jgi:cytochrome c
MARSHAFSSVMTGAVCAAYLMLSVSSSIPQESDVASGQLIFNNVCRTCHTTREGDNRLGPNLYRIIGRKAGSVQDYGYSSAMKGADFVWAEEKLDRFIARPEQLVPGNNMKPFRTRIGSGQSQNNCLFVFGHHRRSEVAVQQTTILLSPQT